MVLTRMGKDWRSGNHFFTFVSRKEVNRIKESIFSEYFRPQDAICFELNKIAKQKNIELAYSLVSFDIQISNIKFHKKIKNNDKVFEKFFKDNLK